MNHPSLPRRRRVRAWSSLAIVPAALLVGSSIGAQPTAQPPAPAGAASAAAPASVGPTRLQAIETPQPMYPPAARAAGHQGTVVIGVVVSERGELLQAKVQRSSRSDELDAAALAAVRRWRFQPATDPTGRPIEAGASVPFTFRKDSATSLPRKTCAELNHDLARWRTLEPEAPLQQADVYPLTQQLALAELQTASALREALAQFPQAFEQAVERCAQQPQARVMAQIRSRLQALSSPQAKSPK